MEQTLHEIISSPQKMRESYVKKNHNQLYKSITDYIDIDISFKEKLWYYVNNIKEEVKCKCGKKTTFNRSFKDGYKKYCSSKCAQSDNETKEKRKKTNIEKYGVDNVSKNENIKNKTKKTNLKKYGSVSSFQNEEVRKKWKENIKKKYGVNHIFQSEEIKDKIKNKMIEKYGDHYTKTESYKDKLNEIGFNEIIRKKKLDKHKNFFKEHGYEFIEIHDYKKFKLKKGDDIFEIYWDTFISRLENGYEISTNKNPLYFTGISESEKEIVNWLKSLNIKNVETSNREILDGKELDIYLPDYNIGIEFNGLYWHSEIKKEKNHHLDKTKKCEERGINLIHIWEDDWKYKRDIVKSIISNRLKINMNKIYARKCSIKKVDTEASRIFLNNNHIQGYSSSSIRYGLHYENELVSLMTFGYRYINNQKNLELLRFCNKINTSVIGSSSKLFKHFIKNNSFDKLISYSDRSIFTGSLYKTLGFENSGETSLNYWWVVDKKRYHRFTFNKQKLIKEGEDPNLTEREIMYKRGSYRIWGCGQIRWIYNM